jgi:hypothetical protein
LSPDEHNAAILCLRANLACGQGGARIEKEEETEVTTLLNNILQNGKEICDHMQEIKNAEGARFQLIQSYP